MLNSESGSIHTVIHTYIHTYKVGEHPCTPQSRCRTSHSLLDKLGNFVWNFQVRLQKGWVSLQDTPQPHRGLHLVGCQNGGIPTIIYTYTIWNWILFSLKTNENYPTYICYSTILTLTYLFAARWSTVGICWRNQAKCRPDTVFT